MNYELKCDILFLLSIYLDNKRLGSYRIQAAYELFYVELTKEMAHGLIKYLKRERMIGFFENETDMLCLNCGDSFIKFGNLCSCYEKLNHDFNYLFSIPENDFQDIEIIFKKIKNSIKLIRLNANRKILENEAEGFFDRNDIGKILDIQDCLCYYCMKPINKTNNRFAIDHVVPLSSGGTNCPINLALTCKICNSKKSWTTESYFLKKIRTGMSEGFIIEHKSFISKIKRQKRKEFKNKI